MARGRPDPRLPYLVALDRVRVSASLACCTRSGVMSAAEAKPVARVAALRRQRRARGTVSSREGNERGFKQFGRRTRKAVHVARARRRAEFQVCSDTCAICVSLFTPMKMYQYAFLNISVHTIDTIYCEKQEAPHEIFFWLSGARDASGLFAQLTTRNNGTWMRESALQTREFLSACLHVPACVSHNFLADFFPFFPFLCRADGRSKHMF